MQRIYINLGVDPHTPHAGTSGLQPPIIAGLLGAPLDVAVAFFRNGTQEALAGSSEGKLVLKQKGARTDPALFQDVTMTADGSGAATTYKFSGVLLSDELIAAIGEDDTLELVGCVKWTEPTEDEMVCMDFEVVLHNSAARDGDSIPATTDARWTWLKAALAAGTGITVTENDTTKVATIASTEPSAATHAARTDNPHGVTKAQVGLGSVTDHAQLKASDLDTDSTMAADSDAKVPSQKAVKAHVASAVSALVAAAPGALDTLDELAAALADDASFAASVTSSLAGKEPTQTAASQAEAEAGTETGIRKWSPLRIKQAIAALAAGGGASLVRGSGVLQGYTTSPIVGTAPPDLVFSASSNDTDFTFNLTVNGTTTTFSIATTDPANGNVWIDSTTFDGVDDATSALKAAIDALAIANLMTVDSSTFLTISHSGLGASLTGSLNVHDGGGSVSGGGTGDAHVAGIGEVMEVTLIASDGAKVTRPIRCGWSGDGVVADIQFALKIGGVYHPIAGDVPQSSTAGECAPGIFFSEWVAGRASGELVVRMTGSAPDGGSLTCWAIAERS